MRHTTGSVYAVFDKPVHMYRGTTMAGHHPGRGAPRSQARLRRRLRDGDAVARPALHGGLPRSRRLGPRLHLGARQLRPTWPACGSSARTCRRRRNRDHAEPDVKDEYGMPVADVHFDDHPNDVAMRNHAYGQGARALRGGRRDPHLPDAALSLDPQSRHQPHEREGRATASSTSSARRTTSRTCSSRTAASSPPAAPRTRR